MNEGNKHFMKLTKFWKVVNLNRSRVAFLGGKVTVWLRGWAQCLSEARTLRLPLAYAGAKLSRLTLR